MGGALAYVLKLFSKNNETKYNTEMKGTSCPRDIKGRLYLPKLPKGDNKQCLR